METLEQTTLACRLVQHAMKIQKLMRKLRSGFDSSAEGNTGQADNGDCPGRHPTNQRNMKPMLPMTMMTPTAYIPNFH